MQPSSLLPLPLVVRVFCDLVKGVGTICFEPAARSSLEMIVCVLPCALEVLSGRGLSHMAMAF